MTMFRSDGGSDQIVSLDGFKIARHTATQEARFHSLRPAPSWHVAPLTPWARQLMELHAAVNGQPRWDGSSAVLGGRGDAHTYVRECEDLGASWLRRWSSSSGGRVGGPPSGAATRTA